MRFAGDMFAPGKANGEEQRAWERGFQEMQKRVEETPSWQVNPQSPNLIHYLPSSYPDELIKELQNPMRNTGVEKELFNNLLNPKNPAPLI